MSEWTIALGALVLLLSLASAALLSRWYVALNGAHRAAPAAEETTPLATLLRPQEVPANDIGWCPVERQDRLHAYYSDGRQCWTCRTFTSAGGAS
ncbi:hypothetical protein ACFVAF_18070 [Streptomyces sp. NPDC057596]|uniref:hypothetical protein n=1 Tax=Streptomyces sp. NPDC057596 TaxID=3346178 RepID=UPI0036C74960